MAIFNGYKSKAEVKRALAAKGFTFSTALGATESNPKLVKGEKLGVLSKPHNLSPASESGWNMCPQASLGCIAACLHTAGNPVYLDAKINARLQRTRAFMTMRKAYVALIAFELEALELKAKRLNMTPAWRPNTTSDYPFHTVALTVNFKPVKSLVHAFPDIEAYDYTKITKKAMQWAAGLLPSNYHITFSKSESNDSDVAKVIKAGGNVAVVFDTKALPDTWQGVPVINGDETDVRFFDESGVIVGLKAKGEAKTDQSGFVVKVSELEAVA
tara:strand:- start:275 stop:1090 length:816 start_codon:yes stop_codon:yes gene_type:complete